MTILCWLLAFWVLIGLLTLVLALVADAWHFRLKKPSDFQETRLSMTLIKPVRGLDAQFGESLESIVAADAQKILQTIIALESETDPAYLVAKAFAAAHPDRDILVLITGPSRGRMGKIHNMIEALPKAKHDCIIFSDADVRTSARLLQATSVAFQKGYDAIYSLPYHQRMADLGGLLFQTFMNYSAGIVFGAYTYYLGFFNFYAGAWMAYRRETLERIGGLSRFSYQIADDFSLGTAAAKIGAKKCFISELAVVTEEGTSLKETFRHFMKWAAIIHSCAPYFYLFFIFLDLPVMAGILWLCSFSAPHFPVRIAEILFAGTIFARMLAAALQDFLIQGSRLPWWAYVLVPLTDIIAVPIGLAGFRRTILWRGTRYRLSLGGEAKVVE